MRQVTYGELLSQLETDTDTENDTHLSNQKKRELINAAVSETWDFIINHGLAEKYVKYEEFTSTQGTLEYPFATICPDGDFYRIHQIYVMESNGQMRPLRRVQPSELMAFKAPQQQVRLRIYYIPCAPNPSTEDADSVAWEATTFDGINGWEEHSVMVAALRVKMKKDDSFHQFNTRKQQLEARIASLANVDFAEPPRIARKRGRNTDPWLLFQQNVNAYGVRSDNLELYFYEGYLP